MKTNRKAAGKRLAAYQAARGRGMNKNAAARSAVRNVPFNQNERKGGAAFMGVKQRPMTPNRAAAPKPPKKTKARKAKKAKAAAPKARKSKRPKPAKKPVDRKKAAKKAAATRRRKKRAKGAAETRAGFGGVAAAAKAGTRARKSREKALGAFPSQYATVAAKAKRRVYFGPFRRAKLTNPRSGRKELSFMYREGKSKRLKKIPGWAIVGASSPTDLKRGLSGVYGADVERKYKAGLEMIGKKRGAAADRIRKSGTPFTPNRRGRKMRANASAAQRRGGKRLAAFRRARAEGKKVKVAAAAALRAVPFTKSEIAEGKTFKGLSTAGAKSVAKKTKRKGKKRGRKAAAKKTTRRKKSRKKSRKTKARKKKSRKKATKSRKKSRKTKARKKATKSRKKSRKSRKGRRSVRVKRKSRSRVEVYAKNKRRKGRRRKMKANRRRMRRNGFMATFMKLVKGGGLILGGFVAHRAGTALGTGLVSRVLPGLAANPRLANWQKPMVGVGVAALEIIGVNVLFKRADEKTRLLLNGGIFTSLLAQTAVSVLTALNQPTLLSYLSGYPNSTAYGLRGRGMRGFERNTQSIMPRYAPVSGMGQYRQAAAGMRGMRGMRGMGEYFASNGLGEYFASSAVQGVGHYEAAGPLALQPNNAVGQIEDGIRPDADLDRVMTLAESAAGLGQGYRQAAAGMGQAYRQAAAGMGRAPRRMAPRRGMRGLGEFYSAQPNNGDFSEYRVPTEDQWIPSGPLWAGEMSAGDTATESEIPAGILQGPGGNGILSG
jgi:hypothetical protein